MLVMRENEVRLNSYQKRWIAKLMSGNTRKTIEFLSNKNGSGHCCLGIAIIECGLEPIGTPNNRTSEDLAGFPKTLTKLKLNSDIGKINTDLLTDKWKDDLCRHNSLAELNDNGWSHEKIGRFINENRSAVFIS